MIILTSGEEHSHIKSVLSHSKKKNTSFFSLTLINKYWGFFLFFKKNKKQTQLLMSYVFNNQKFKNDFNSFGQEVVNGTSSTLTVSLVYFTF